jgi:hypothetical protein
MWHAWKEDEWLNGLMWKPKRNTPLGTHRHRYNDNIKIHLIDWRGMDWIHLPQDRGHWRPLVNTVMILRVFKVERNSWVAERLAASQEGLSTLELVISILRAWTDQLVAEEPRIDSSKVYRCLSLWPTREEGQGFSYLGARRQEREGVILHLIPRYNCHGCAEQ